MMKWLPPSVVLLAGALAVSACGSDDNQVAASSSSTSASTGGSGGSGGGGAAGGAAAGGMGGSGAGTPQECVAMVERAQAFLDALDDNQHDTATTDFGSDEHRRFEFLPPLSAPRDGLSMKDMTMEQQMLLGGFLQSAMSQAGYMKIEAIRALESVLAMQESGMPVTDNRDPENYFVQFFGVPVVRGEEPWGFRFEGHHLSVQAGVIDCSVFSATPAFWGVSPQLDPLQTEVDSATQLIASLDAEQQNTAQGSVSGNALDEKVGKLDPITAEGLRAGDMTAAQQQLLRQLIGAFLGNMNAVIAAQRLEAIEAAGFDDVTFLYDGNDFRVMGPSFIIEWVYAGNTHVHSVWRDYDGDYGDDLIAQHMNRFH